MLLDHFVSSDGAGVCAERGREAEGEEEGERGEEGEGERAETRGAEETQETEEKGNQTEIGQNQE